ncbi:hypothetical protein, partial [Staphylococcus pasteuri]|uniref:hypothetical protein n=1 Tax=Staphylococcus pasteuri TaxID=45972 RepID=UPI001C99F93A
IIFKPKNQFNKYHHTTYPIQHLQYQLSPIIKTLFNPFNKDNPLKNHYPYFTSSLYNLFLHSYHQHYQNPIISTSTQQLIQQQISHPFTQLQNNIQHQTNISYHSL